MKQDPHNKEKKNNGYKLAVIHLSWIIVIVCLGAAGVAGIFLSTETGAFILSTISTVTSIILSVVAIIFTLFQSYKADQYNDEVKNIIYESMRDSTRDMAQIQQFMKDYKELHTDLRRVLAEENDDTKAIKKAVSQIVDKSEDNLRSLHLSNTDFWFND